MTLLKNIRHRRMVTFADLLVFCLLSVTAQGLTAEWTPPSITRPANLASYPERPINFVCGWGVGGGSAT